MDPVDDAALAAAEAEAAVHRANANVAAAEAEVTLLRAGSSADEVVAKEEALGAARVKATEASVAAVRAIDLASAPELTSDDEDTAKNAAKAVSDAAAEAVAAATASAQTEWKEDLRRAF